MVQGPVITISRECGCSARRIASKLAKVLTGYSYRSETKTDVEWEWVSKEVIETAARNPDRATDKVREVLLEEKACPLNAVSDAFSPAQCYAPTHLHGMETTATVVRDFAGTGHFIVVGRGGVLLTNHVANRLSVRLQAPLEWRVNRIQQISNRSYPQARDYVMAVDAAREQFMEQLAGRSVCTGDFDVVFNYSTLMDDHIVDAMVTILKSRQLI